MTLREIYLSKEPKHRMVVLILSMPFMVAVVALIHLISPYKNLGETVSVLLALYSFYFSQQLFRWWFKGRYHAIDQAVIADEREAARKPPTKCGQCGIDLLPMRSRCRWCGWEAARAATARPAPAIDSLTR